MVCSASGSSTPGLSLPLAKMRPRVLPSSMHRPWAGSNRNHVFGAQSHSGFDSQSIPFTLTTFCGYASISDFGGEPPYTLLLTANLNTGPVASSYPGGIHTRSSSNYFQSARASSGSPILLSTDNFDFEQLSVLVDPLPPNAFHLSALWQDIEFNTFILQFGSPNR